MNLDKIIKEQLNKYAKGKVISEMATVSSYCKKAFSSISAEFHFCNAAENYIKKTSPSAYRNIYPNYNGGEINPNIHGNLNLIQKAGFYNKIEESNLQDILNESKMIIC
jgi:hypothetical protein